MMAERNFAYIYEDESHEGSESETDRGPEDNKPQEEEASYRIRVRHTQARSGSVMTIILVSALAALLLGTVIYSLDRRNTMYNRVSAKNHELSLVEAENVRLQSELDSSVSAKNVEDYAENVLHMQKIDSSQIKYIKIQTGDVVDIPEQDKGIKAKVKSFFDDIVEYFKG
jgi:cell division protein FtsL